MLPVTDVAVLQFRQRQCRKTVHPRRAAFRRGIMASNWRGWRWANLMGSWPSLERRWWFDTGAASRMARSLTKLKATRHSVSGLVGLLHCTALPSPPLPAQMGFSFPSLTQLLCFLVVNPGQLHQRTVHLDIDTIDLSDSITCSASTAPCLLY